MKMGDTCTLELEIDSLVKRLSLSGIESLFITAEVDGDITETYTSDAGQLFLNENSKIPEDFLYFCKKFSWTHRTKFLQNDKSVEEVCNPEFEEINIKKSIHAGKVDLSNQNESKKIQKAKGRTSTKSLLETKCLRKSRSVATKTGHDPQRKFSQRISRTKVGENKNAKPKNLCKETKFENLYTGVITRKRSAKENQKNQDIIESKSLGKKSSVQDTRKSSYRTRSAKTPKDTLTKIKLSDSGLRKMTTRRTKSNRMGLTKIRRSSTDEVVDIVTMENDIVGESSLRDVEKLEEEEVFKTQEDEIVVDDHIPNIEQPDVKMDQPTIHIEKTRIPESDRMDLTKIRRSSTDEVVDIVSMGNDIVGELSLQGAEKIEEEKVFKTQEDEIVVDEHNSNIKQPDDVRTDRLTIQIEKLAQRITSNSADLLKQLKEQENIVMMEVQREGEQTECEMQVEFITTTEGSVPQDNSIQSAQEQKDGDVVNIVEGNQKENIVLSSTVTAAQSDGSKIVKVSDDNNLTADNVSTDLIKNKIPSKPGKYSCPVCSYKTENKSVLTTHLLIHGGEKKFACKRCDKKFLRKTDAIRHEETHSTERKYMCTEADCGCIFKTFQGLKKHKVNVHAFKPSDIKNPLSKRSDLPKSLTCDLCNKVFNKLFSLRRHQMVHANLRPFKCPICDRAFFRKEDMMKHQRSHTNERPFACSICFKSFKSKQGKANHIKKLHGNKRFKCDVCHGIFKSFYTLKNHKKQHSDNDKGNITIDLFSGNEATLDMASAQSSSEVLSGNSETATSVECDERTVAVLQNGIYQCHLCRKPFKKPLSLFKHLKMHDAEGKFTCNVCFIQYDTQNQFRKHEVMHKEQKPLSCETCNKSFKGRRNLRMHQLVHTEEKNFICEQCGKSFRVKQQLKDHYRVHTGERPFKCDVCGKAFRMKDTLNNHMAIHNDFKKYMCDTCGKTFRQQSCLLTHQKVHTDKPTHVCTICNKGCKSASALKSHTVSFHLSPEDIIRLGVIVHNCNVCGKAFGDRQDRDRHLRMHTGEKPFSCEICHKKFSDRSNMRAHLRNHNAERPQKCELCGKGFLFKRDLKKHMIAHDRNTVRLNISASANLDQPEFVPLPNNCVTVTTQEPMAEQIIFQAFNQDYVNQAPSPSNSQSRTLSEVSEETFTAASAIALMQEATMSQIDSHATVQHVYPGDTADLVWQSI